MEIAKLNNSDNGNILEYLISVCDKEAIYQPSHICDQFACRYLKDKIALPKKAISNYLDDDELMAMLEYYGLDVSKFWYYSVWAFDYVLNLNSQTIDNASDEFYKILNALEQTTLDELNTNDEAELSLRITKNGKKPQKITSTNQFTISAIYYGMKLLDQHLTSNEPFSIGTGEWWATFNNSERPVLFDSLELKETYNVYYYRDKMMLLLKGLRKAKGQKKSGSTSKDYLISKMVYVLGLSRNDEYRYNPTFLRTTIKNVDVGKYDVVNNVYDC